MPATLYRGYGKNGGEFQTLCLIVGVLAGRGPETTAPKVNDVLYFRIPDTHRPSPEMIGAQCMPERRSVYVAQMTGPSHGSDCLCDFIHNPIAIRDVKMLPKQKVFSFREENSHSFSVGTAGA